MLKKILTYTALVVLVVYAIIATVWANHQAADKHCTGIDIIIEQQDGAQQQFVSIEGVKADLGHYVTDYGRYTLSNLDINDIERRMQRNNNYELVECALTSLGRLRINIVPMIPEARVITPNGNGYYINRDGKRMDARPDFHMDVPVIGGTFNKSFTAAHVLPVVRYVRNNEKLSGLVSMIYARDPNNIYVIPRIKGHVVCLGDTNDLPTKFSNLLLMYDKVLPYKGWETYDTISVKFKGQVVATRSNKVPQHIPENFEDEEDADEQALQAANPDAVETPIPTNP